MTMDNLEEEDDSHAEERAPAASGTEHSRLVGPSANTKMSKVNIVSNAFALIFFAFLFYQTFIVNFSLFSFHPTCMTIGWLLVMVSAINSITPGDFATEWLPIRLRSARHWVLQLVGIFFLATGFTIILINKEIHNKEHFTSLHGRFGLTSLILVASASTGGLLALYSLKLKQYIAPVFIKSIHAVAGLGTFITGCVTILLGIFSEWWSFGEVSRIIAVLLILTIMLFTVTRPTIKIYIRIREKMSHIVRE